MYSVSQAAQQDVKDFMQHRRQASLVQAEDANEGSTTEADRRAHAEAAAAKAARLVREKQVGLVMQQPLALECCSE